MDREVMSRPQRELPFTERIDSKLLAFEMNLGPPGQPCTVHLRWCYLKVVRERHLIGGEIPRKNVQISGLKGQQREVAHSVHGGPAVFRSEGACRGAVSQILEKELPGLIHAVSKDVEYCWDKFVPADLVERIVAGAAAGGGSYACDVWMLVEITRVYSEAEELLLLCEDAGVAQSDVVRAPGAGDVCPICMNEMTDGGVTTLPDCSHAFHRECIVQWFGKAPTCPCCRRDMMQQLNPIFPLDMDSSRT